MKSRLGKVNKASVKVAVKKVAIVARADNNGVRDVIMARAKAIGKPFTCPDMWRYLNQSPTEAKYGDLAAQAKSPQKFSFARRGQVRAILGSMISAGTLKRWEKPEDVGQSGQFLYAIETQHKPAATATKAVPKQTKKAPAKKK